MPSERKIKKVSVKLLQIKDEELLIHTPFIKLDAALKLSNIAQTGGHAKLLVEEERIRVNGEKCLQRGKKLFPGDTFEFHDLRYTVKAQHEN